MIGSLRRPAPLVDDPLLASALLQALMSPAVNGKAEEGGMTSSKMEATKMDDGGMKSAGSYDENRIPTSREFWIIPIPKRMRYNAADPPNFNMTANILFGFIGLFTVANLYYIQPILIDLSREFNVSYEEVSRLPTLTQAGYASGLLLITPTGDLLKRRQLMMVCVLLSLFSSIALAVTNSFAVFEAFCFLIGFLSVTPQILMPLAVDLAKPAQRGQALSTVLSGMLCGIMLARLLSGIIAQYSSYRNVYYMAAGLQGFIILLIYGFVPDYPQKNANLSYFKIIKTMLVFAFTEPILIQGCLISALASSNFANFWVTLTFLLGDEPYNYNTLQIGLFGLLGVFAVISAPIVGRIVDKLHAWLAICIGLGFLLAGMAVYTAGAGLSLAAIIIGCFLLDIGNQLQQVAVATRNRTIDPAAFSRINSVYIIFIFLGQVMGTQAGSLVLLRHGYRTNGALCLGLLGAAFLILLARGPFEPRKTWFGWRHGRKRPQTLEISKEEQPDIQDKDTRDLEMRASS